MSQRRLLAVFLAFASLLAAAFGGVVAAENHGTVRIASAGWSPTSIESSDVYGYNAGVGLSATATASPASVASPTAISHSARRGSPGTTAVAFRGFSAAEEGTIGGPLEFDPGSLTGQTPAEVESQIPASWERVPSKSGGGEVFRDPNNPGRQIRIMPGYGAGARPDPLTEGPYAVVSQNATVTKVPLAGNPTLP